MDRRHRAILTLLCVGVCGLGIARGQQPGASPAATPDAAATPWVQASPPVGKPAPPAPKPAADGKPMPPNVLRQEMERRRQQELAAASANPEPELARAMQGMTPDERRAFERNLAVWQTLSPAERQALRGQAVDHVREEIEKAYRDSGLALTPDQREVFGLRYRQERRRLERELQERIKAERARRLPEMVDRLKKEFAPPAGSPAPGGTP